MKTTKGKLSTEENPDKEDLKRKIATGEKDEDVYDETSSEILEEDDEISDLEEGFAEGYKEDLSKCALCGKLIKSDEPVELEIKGEHYMFCSAEHANIFKKQQK